MINKYIIIKRKCHVNNIKDILNEVLKGGKKTGKVLSLSH